MARTQQDLALRLEVEELFTEYTHVLDDGELEQWPEFFTDDCLYQIVSRENPTFTTASNTRIGVVHEFGTRRPVAAKA